MGVCGEILCLSSDQAWLYKKRWGISCKFQLENTRNKKVIAKKPLDKLICGSICRDVDLMTLWHQLYVTYCVTISAWLIALREGNITLYRSVSILHTLCTHDSVFYTKWWALSMVTCVFFPTYIMRLVTFLLQKTCLLNTRWRHIYKMLFLYIVGLYTSSSCRCVSLCVGVKLMSGP